MANKIVCRFCAAEFKEMLPECPYCGATNYIGAEAEYLDKLEDIREDMEELEDIPEEETKKVFKKQGTFLKKLFIFIGVLAVVIVGLLIWNQKSYDRDEKAGFLWRQENVPVMNELYEQGKYDDVVKIYYKAYAQDISLYDWEHMDFFERYEAIQFIQETIAEEADGHELSQLECELIFYDQWRLKGLEVADLDETERAILTELSEGALQDFEERWNMSEEDYKQLYDEMKRNRGYVSYTSCEKYIAKWYKENK